MNDRSVAAIIGDWQDEPCSVGDCTAWSRPYGDDQTEIMYGDADGDCLPQPTVDDILAWFRDHKNDIDVASYLTEVPVVVVIGGLLLGDDRHHFEGPTLLAALEAAVRGITP